MSILKPDGEVDAGVKNDEHFRANPPPVGAMNAQQQAQTVPLTPEKQLALQMQIAKNEAIALQNQIAQLSEQLAIAQQVATKDKQRFEDINAYSARIKQDFENYKKRTADDVKKASVEGQVRVIERVLPAMDVIKHAVNMMTDEKVIEGLKMIYRQLNETLASCGVEEIPALGEKFNPEVHNAMVQVTVKDKSQAGIVVEVFKKGYRLGDRIIRHSEVKVAN